MTVKKFNGMLFCFLWNTLKHKQKQEWGGIMQQIMNISLQAIDQILKCIMMSHTWAKDKHNKGIQVNKSWGTVNNWMQSRDCWLQSFILSKYFKIYDWSMHCVPH